MPTATRSIEFATRGHRRKPGYGLYYMSRCGRYALYASDQVGGIPCDRVRWLAMALYPPHIISRHRKRESAERACRRHERTSSI